MQQKGYKMTSLLATDFTVKPKRHFAYLDAIRGLAALAVICEHYIIAYGLPCRDLACQKIMDYSPLNFWWDGSAAVAMFFVLSGLVLSLKYFQTGSGLDLNQFHLGRYVLGRLFRIWLPYGVVLLISAGLYLYATRQPLLNTLLPASEWIIGLWNSHPLSLIDMLREAFLLKLPELVVLLPQAWTLTIELVLSLLLPIGLILAQRGVLWLMFFSVFAVSFLGVSLFLLHFVVGLLIAQHHARIDYYLNDKPGLRRSVLWVGLSFYASGSIIHQNLGDTVVTLTYALGSGLILLYVLCSQRSQQLLSYSLFRQLGKVSYSAYLIHMAILICLTPHLLKALESLTSNHLGLWLGGWLSTVLVVQVLSLLFFQLLEKPCINIGRQAVNRLYPSR